MLQMLLTGSIGSMGLESIQKARFGSSALTHNNGKFEQHRACTCLESELVCRVASLDAFSVHHAAVGLTHMCAVVADGMLTTWGGNDWGQLGASPQLLVYYWTSAIKCCGVIIRPACLDKYHDLKTRGKPQPMAPPILAS